MKTDMKETFYEIWFAGKERENKPHALAAKIGRAGIGKPRHGQNKKTGQEEKGVL